MQRSSFTVRALDAPRHVRRQFLRLKKGDPGLNSLRDNRLPDRRNKMKKSLTAPKDGPHKELFAGGKVSGEGHLRNGKRQGAWKFYHLNGKLKAVGKYVDGALYGYWEWFRENGKPLQAGAFEGSAQVGLWKRYYDSGQLWDEGRYEHGKKVGQWKTFAKDGSLKQSKVFNPKK